MLRDSVNGFPEQHWRAADAVARSADSAAVVAIWTKLVAQALAGLGTNPVEGGVREIATVMKEFGRAASPAPSWKWRPGAGPIPPI